MEKRKPIISILDSGQSHRNELVNGFTMFLFVCIITFRTNFDIACTKFDLEEILREYSGITKYVRHSNK